MVKFNFHGFTAEEVAKMMPRIVEILGLGHPMYSLEVLAPVTVCDEKGIPRGKGNMIEIPPFDKVRQNLNLLNDISREFDCPVVTLLAEPKLARGDALY